MYTVTVKFRDLDCLDALHLGVMEVSYAENLLELKMDRKTVFYPLDIIFRIEMNKVGE